MEQGRTPHVGLEVFRPEVTVSPASASVPVGKIPGRKSLVPVREVEELGPAELLYIRHAASSLRRLPGDPQNREQEGREESEDGQDRQQFDEGETTSTNSMAIRR